MIGSQIAYQAFRGWIATFLSVEEPIEIPSNEAVDAFCLLYHQHGRYRDEMREQVKRSYGDQISVDKARWDKR